MHLSSYQILSKSENSTEYKFISIGPKGSITKFIIFEELSGEANLYNLALVDQLDNDIISDSSASNNGDLRKILATVAKVLVDYTLVFPERTIFFQGSDETGKRTTVYNRAISTHFSFLAHDFIIEGITEENVIEQYNPVKTYIGFLVKRK